MRYLEERRIGYDVGVTHVPIVPAYIIFDLGVSDGRIPPDAQAGYRACEPATTDRPVEGNVGAGAGATVGTLFGARRAMKGGVGMASLRVAGLTVGTLVVVNAVGDVIDPDTARPIAGARTEHGHRLLDARRAIAAGHIPERLPAGTDTTIGVVATDALLTKTQAQKIAQMAHDGLAPSIKPVHTISDGDTVFALGTGKPGKTGNPNLLGMLGAEVMARAVVRAVRAAQGIEGYPSAADIG